MDLIIFFSWGERRGGDGLPTRPLLLSHLVWWQLFGWEWNGAKEELISVTQTVGGGGEEVPHKWNTNGRILLV